MKHSTMRLMRTATLSFLGPGPKTQVQGPRDPLGPLPGKKVATMGISGLGVPRWRALRAFGLACAATTAAQARGNTRTSIATSTGAPNQTALNPKFPKEALLIEPTS